MKRVLFVALALFAACGPPGLNQVRPQLQPPASPQDFGTVPVLNESTLDVPLLNLGRAVLTVTAVTVSPDDGVFQLRSTPPAEVSAGNTENLTLAFVPKAEQAYEATLTIESDDPENPSVAVVLEGVGSTRALMEVTPASLDFGRVAECGSAVQQLTIESKGTADLLITDIAFSQGTAPGFSFVGSTRTPATVPFEGMNGLPGRITLTVKYTAEEGSTDMATGGIVLKTTDPEQQEVTIPLTAALNKAPLAAIAPLGNGAPGLTVDLDGSASSDPDGDVPLAYKWTIRSKPLSSTTSIAGPELATTQMTLDPAVPGAYEVQLDVTDATGAKSCHPARATVVAAPAQKLLVEMFWDNTGTDLDLHVLRSTQAPFFSAPDDCFYQNRAPDWGLPGAMDDPEFVRDALRGYGPEIFGYVNPIDTTYRVIVYFQNDLLSPTPASKATVRVYLYGVLKAELSRTLAGKDQAWEVADVTWPSGDVTALP